MKNTYLNKRGFTLPELLIVVGIFSLLIVVLSNVFTSIVQERLSSEASNTIAREESYIFNRMAYDMGRATSVSAPSANSSGSTLSLTIGGVTNSYALSSDNLMFGPTGSQKNIMDKDVSVNSLQFTRMQDMAGKASVKVEMIIRSKVALPGARIVERNFTYVFGLR